MKKLLFSIISLAMLFMVSCKGEGPKDIAQKFLDAVAHMEYDEAKKYATEDTKSTLDMLQSFVSMADDSTKADAKKVKVDILNVQEEGDKASVTYTTSEDNTERVLQMVKQDNKWLCSWNKTDQATPSEPVQEDVPADTVAAPAADSVAAAVVE